MTRRAALLRLLVGIPYVPIYYLILYPISLAIGLVLGAAAIAWELITGDPPNWAPRQASRVWSHPSDNMKWVMSGEGEFELLP